MFSKIIVGFTSLNGCTFKVNVDDGFLNLMTNDGTAKDDVKVPEGEIGIQIQSGFDEGKELLVTIVSAMGEEQVSFAIPTFGLNVRLKAGRPSHSRKPRKALSPYSCSSCRYFLSHPRAPAFYAHPFIVLTDVILSCMYFFHGLIQRVYCKVALSVLRVAWIGEVRLYLAVSCEKYSDEKTFPVSYARINQRAQLLALKIISVRDATKKQN